MTINFNKRSIPTTFHLILNSKVLFWSILLIFPVLTFNFYSPDYNIGLDPSYAWAYNSLLLNKFSSLQKIVYPYGLFGFLKMPFPYYNLYFLYFLCVFLSKSVFCYLFLKFTKSKAIVFTLINLFALFFCCNYLYTDYLLLGSLLLLMIGQFYRYNKYFFIAAALLLLSGMLIKANIMISGILLYLVSFAVTWLFSSNKKQQVLNYTLGFILFSVLGIVFYGGIQNFATFIKGSFILSGGYSEALCSTIEIDLMYFIPFFILLLFYSATSIYQKKYIELILLAFLFFAWKHTVVRLDSGHYYNLIMSLVLFSSIWIVISSKFSTLKYFLSLACIYSFYTMGNKLSLIPDGIEIRNGLKEFVFTVTNYDSIVKKCDSIVDLNFNKSELPVEAKKIIGRSKIDAYPWELSYFRDSTLNYTPRYTLQSGGNSTWLDNYSKNSIIEQDIKYYIFHSTYPEKIKLLHIDGRYLFNEEPNTLMHLLSNYNSVYSNSAFTLLEKASAPRLIQEKLSEPINVKFNEWIAVLSDSEHVNRLKVDFKKPFSYKLTSFIYKPSVFYITYKFKDDSTTDKMRFVPANAKDGIWINPFYFDFNTTKRVKEILFESSDTTFYKTAINVTLDAYKINKKVLSSPDSLFSVIKKLR